MSDNTKGYLGLAGMGAAFGITTSILSCISHEALGVSLGFSPVSLKNVIKVGVLSGGTLSGLFAIDNKWGIFTSLGI